MTWYLSRALVTLRGEIEAAWPGRSKISDGSIGDAAHASRPSDHNPDPSGPDKGEVRAIDVTQWDPGTPENPRDDVAEAVAEQLRASRDPRILYVIWRGRMFSSYPTSSTPAWTWRPYTGPNGHFHHVHISVRPGSGSGRWGIRRPGTGNAGRTWKPFRPGATDRSVYAAGGLDNEVTELQLILKALGYYHGKVDGIYGPVSGAATSAFKRAHIALQKMTGQRPVWPNTDRNVGYLTIAGARWWNSHR